MIEGVQVAVLLLVVLAAVALAARRLKLPPAILLVIVGVVMALIPGLPRVQLVPELVLLLVLPPLIYSAGVAMSWREFKFNLRPITLLAFGCVIFTTVAVAAVAHELCGLPWSVAFVLGAIVSPPDAVAPLAIARRLGLPRRLLVILEGEGLANDATALILYRFAVAAVSTGAFSFGPAIGTFAAIFVGEIAYGAAVGWVMLRVRHWARDPRVEITLSLVTPYLAFWVPEHLGGSGVLATVACGLHVSWNGPIWIASATRLQGVFFWDLFIYLVEGFVFLLTGLQAHTLAERIAAQPLGDLLNAAAAISGTVILARYLWVFPATYVPRWTIPSLARRAPAPPWTNPFLLAFAGIRGIVSLAAALAIPLTTETGEPFPFRDLVLFLTFCVIVVTLVGQGLAMPAIIRWLGFADVSLGERRLEEAEELAARRAAIDAVLRRLDELAAEYNLPPQIVEPMRAFHLERMRHLGYKTAEDNQEQRLGLIANHVEHSLIQAERDEVYRIACETDLKDDARRRIENELDLREAQLMRTAPRSGND